MRRLALTLSSALGLLLVSAPIASAHDGGQGLLGEVDDLDVTIAGFILIVVFPLFVLLASLLYHHLEHRKDERKAASKSLATKWHGGW